MIELLAPAGDFEKLKFAINYGANAVYLGFKNFGLRANAKNFDETLAIIQKEYRNARIAVGQDPDECK